MPMKFNLKRDPTAGLVPEGVHRFVVEHAEEKNGPKGAYLNMRLRVYVKGVKWGSSVFEILSTSDESKFRVDQFFDAVGAPSEGEAAESWFLNKTGYARFEQRVSNNGDLQTRVKNYLTPEAAENIIDKMGEEDNDNEPVKTKTVNRAATPAPGRKASGKKEAVPELAEEDLPF